MARQSIATQIQEIVSSFDESGERMLRGKIQRRHGAKGFGYYGIIDVAYEGQRVVFFRNLDEAKAWAKEKQEAE